MTFSGGWITMALENTEKGAISMLLSQHPRTHYANAPVHEVICQLRFPAILSINHNEPAEFQDRIRAVLPQYARRKERPAPNPAPGSPPQAEAVNNYHFLSADGKWKLNLTRNFIALSTLAYPGWEDFARMLDKPLAEFIQIYQPAYFQRIGLRYVNIFSRKKLGLEDTPWSELFTPPYLGPLAEPDIDAEQVPAFSGEFTVKMDSSCSAKIKAGTGRLQTRPGIPADLEEKYILDLDLSMSGNLPCTIAAGALETLHGHAAPLFEGAVTEPLREAMGAR